MAGQKERREKKKVRNNGKTKRKEQNMMSVKRKSWLPALHLP